MLFRCCISKCGVCIRFTVFQSRCVPSTWPLSVFEARSSASNTGGQSGPQLVMEVGTRRSDEMHLSDLPVKLMAQITVVPATNRRARGVGGVTAIISSCKCESRVRWREQCGMSGKRVGQQQHHQEDVRSCPHTSYVMCRGGQPRLCSRGVRACTKYLKRAQNA